MKYRQAIQIDERHMESIFRLPCVLSIHKNRGRFYARLDFAETGDSYAYPTDWLVEDESGVWHRISDDNFKKIDKK